MAQIPSVVDAGSTAEPVNNSLSYSRYWQPPQQVLGGPSPCSYDTMDLGPLHAHEYPDNYTGSLLFAHLKAWLAIVSTRCGGNGQGSAHVWACLTDR